MQIGERLLAGSMDAAPLRLLQENLSHELVTKLRSKLES